MCSAMRVISDVSSVVAAVKALARLRVRNAYGRSAMPTRSQAAVAAGAGAGQPERASDANAN